MRLLHDLAKIHATFDDPNLVSRAGLVPVMALAQRAGLGGLAGEHVRIARRCGVNAPANRRRRSPSATAEYPAHHRRQPTLAGAECAVAAAPVVAVRIAVMAAAAQREAIRPPHDIATVPRQEL